MRPLADSGRWRASKPRLERARPKAQGARAKAQSQANNKLRPRRLGHTWHSARLARLARSPIGAEPESGAPKGAARRILEASGFGLVGWRLQLRSDSSLTFALEFESKFELAIQSESESRFKSQPEPQLQAASCKLRASEHPKPPKPTKGSLRDWPKIGSERRSVVQSN